MPAIATTFVKPAGMVVWCSELRPHATTVPSDFNARLCQPPPKCVRNGVGSNDLIVAMPLRPWTIASQVVAVSFPSGVTIVTIEHNMQVMMRISDRILALYAGRRIAFGKPEDVRADPAVVDAYLGTTTHAA